MNLFTKVMPTDAQSRKIMEERAALLAVETVDTVTVDATMVNYIRFKLGNNELYGLPYHEVREVMSVDKITAVPMSPGFVLGVIYWHGKLISVVDLANYFGIKDSTNTEVNKLIAIVSYEKSILGLKFHDVTGVDSYSQEALDKNLAMNTNIKDVYVHGIHHGRVTILNIQQIVSDLTAELMKQRGSL